MASKTRAALLIVMIHLYFVAFLKAAPTEPPDKSSQDEDELDYDSILCSLDEDVKRNIVQLITDPLTKAEYAAVARRSADLATRMPTDRLRRASELNQTAIIMGRLMTHDDFFGQYDATNYISSPATRRKEERRNSTDPDWNPRDACNFEYVRDVPISSMRTVLQLRDQGRKDKSLQGLFKWYNPTRVRYYRECAYGSGTIHYRMREVNNRLLQQIVDARRENRAVSGRNIRRWALILADEYNIPRTFFKASRSWLWRFVRRAQLRRRGAEWVSR